jgi:hypothetical protein
MLWYDTTNKVLNLYDGNNWITINNNSGSSSSSCCDTLNSAFLNKDPSSQPILRAVYINSSAPSNPVADMLWYDTSNNLLKLYDGNNWNAINDVSTLKSQITSLNSAFVSNDPTQPILRAVSINSSAPSNPVADMLWYDTSNNNNILKLYDGNNWQSINDLSSINNSISDLNSKVKSLNSAFVSNDPTQPILRAVSISSSAPSNPVADMLWYDTGNSLLKLYDGNNWNAINDVSTLKSQINNLNSAFMSSDPTKTIQRATYIGSSAPSNPVAGTTWLDTSQSTPTLKIYDGSNWQSISGGSSSSNNRVDLSNATSDYNLDVNQEAIINFSNATSVALHISTTNGTYYQMDIVSSNGNSGSDNPAYLNPNNTTYSNAFTYEEVYRDTGGQGSNSSTYNSYRIGWAFPSIRAYITNYTSNKHVNTINSSAGASHSPSIDINTCYWKDTSTAWSSLGTITFPQSTSGFILVKRLV